MPLRLPSFLLLSVTFATMPAVACLPVAGDRILARDMVAAVPEFSALPEATVLGYAPMPGAVRKFAHTELESIARTHRLVLTTTVAEVCFAVPQSEHLDESAVLVAIRKVLPAEASAAILELPKFPVPQGEIVFPMDGIEPPQPSDPTAQMWKGFIRYGTNRRLPVWARVRMSVERPAVVAKRALRPGETITEDAVEIVSKSGPIRADRTASTTAEVVGKAILRSVKIGDPISMSYLERSALVRRGDAVKVQVISGDAHLMLSAIAETSARAGEQVQLRNPASGKTFFARLESADSAVLSVASNSSIKVK